MANFYPPEPKYLCACCSEDKHKPDAKKLRLCVLVRGTWANIETHNGSLVTGTKFKQPASIHFKLCVLILNKIS